MLIKDSWYFLSDCTLLTKQLIIYLDEFLYFLLDLSI